MLKRLAVFALLCSVSLLMEACGSGTGTGTGTAGGGSAMTGGTTSPSGGVTVLGGSTSSPGGTTTSAGGTTMASGGTTSLAGSTTAATGGAANATGGSTSSASGMAVTQYAWTRQWGTPGPYTWQEKWTATPDGTLTYRDMSKIEVRSAVMSSSDIVEFDQFLEDPSLADAISDPTPCSAMIYYDRGEWVSLEFADGRPDVSKSLMSCTGPVYDGIHSWNGRLGSYFP